MTLAEVRKTAGIAAKAGLLIEELDYGWTVHALNDRVKKVLIVSEVFRQERDGYTGGRLITEETLLEWIKEHPV